MSKKVLLIPDLPNWALDKNAKDLIKYNKSNIQLDICYYKDFEKDWKNYYSQYDLLFPMYMGIFFSFLKLGIPTDKVITGIRSYHRWDKKKTVPPGYNSKPSRKIVNALKKALLVNTNCKKLWYIFSQYFPVAFTKYTCDINTFYPEQKKDYEKFIIGWAGSLTNHGKKRGFDEFIKPICDELPNVELKIQTKEDNFVTDDQQMREFYNSLDLYFAASRTESGPRTVLEAAACGIPVISTDIGLVPELIENEVDGFIVDRDYEVMKKKISWIINNREILPSIGNKIRKKMEDEFNWEKIVFQWTDFFKYALELKRLKENGFVK